MRGKKMIYKQVTELTLRNGEKLHVTAAEGNSARTAKASERSKSIMFPSIRNRMIDASFIVDIQDKSVEDPVATAAQQLADSKRSLISAGLLEPEEDSRYRPGYIKYIVACIKLRKKAGKGIMDIRDKLDEKQTELVRTALETESLEF